MTKHHPNYVPPYDTGRVKIGLHYQPPQRDYNTPESLRIQQVLLRKTAPQPQPRLPRFPRRLILNTETACLLLACVVVALALVI